MKTLEFEPAVLAILPRDEEPAIAPLFLAFAQDPAVRWMYPDSHQYRVFFPRFIRAFGGRAFGAGTAFSVAENRGTALWLPPGVGPDESALVSLIQESVEPDRLEDIFALLEKMGEHHPSEPHWHLSLLGVDPFYQRQGLGSALLGRMLETLDHAGALAYLEATDELNVPFYESHGFKLRAEIQAGSSPTIFAMEREPR